ncbi:MAG: nucleotide exchange factor GrpE [Chloroflexota bacterium]|nr:MAG: nucleotide exchange factor GrpE [Chloroflexota bacterium]
MMDDHVTENRQDVNETEGTAQEAEDQASVEQVASPDVAALGVELAEEKARAQQYLANWQRAQADFSNYKKRVEQERTEAVKFANAMLIVTLLPVLDDFERAMASVPTSLAGFTWFEGARLIQRKLQAILQAQGVTEIPTEGQAFDPTIHDAVAHGPGEEGKVVEELQKGYRLHNRVIRPALVRVGQGTTSTD